MNIIYFGSNESDSDEIIKSITNGSGPIRRLGEDLINYYLATDDITINPFSTVVIDTCVNFQVDSGEEKDYVVQFSKLDHALNLIAITPLFSSKCPVKIQATNISKRYVKIPKGHPLFSIIKLSGESTHPIPNISLGIHPDFMGVTSPISAK